MLSTTTETGIEFNDYLDGFYDIDINESTIDFTLVAAANDPTYSGFFRTIESNTFNRYYFKFTTDHNITSATSNNSSVLLNIKPKDEIVVEIS